MSPATRQKSLQLLGQQQTGSAVRPDSIKHEGRTDLIAFITENDVVTVTRLGGQLVQNLGVDDLSGKPTCLEWDRGGGHLLVGTDSGTVDVIQLDGGRPRQRERTSVDRDSPVTTVCAFHSSCGRAISASKASRREDSTDLGSLASWLEQIKVSGNDSLQDQGTAEGTPSLPEALAQMDANNVLPRLSPIAAPSKAGPGMPTPVLKSTVKGLHDLINSKTEHNPNHVEASFTTGEDGLLLVRVGELFSQTFRIGAASHGVLHSQCANAALGVNAVIEQHRTEQSGKQNKISKLVIHLYQLPSSRSNSIHTGMIMAEAVQLRWLQMYITQAVDTAALDWTTLMSLPGRLMMSINETLEEKQEGSLQNLFTQMLLTGYCSDAVSEWLKDELGERGHKRWDLAITTSYNSLGHLLQVNILPAIEKCIICASSLRGLATYYEGSNKFDVSPHFFTTVIEALCSLQILAHECLRILSTEQKQFIAFSKWLRIRVDIATSEPGSATSIELLESEAANTDVPTVLSYLTTAFVKSELEPFIGRETPGLAGKSEPLKALTAEDTMNGIKAQRLSVESRGGALRIQSWVQQLHEVIDVCLTNMKKWQSTTWLPPTVCEVAFEHPLAKLGFMLQSADNGDSQALRIVAVDADKTSRLITQTVTLEYNAKALRYNSTVGESSVINFPKDTIIKNSRVLESGAALVLLENVHGKHQIVQIPAPVISSHAAQRTLTTSDTEQLTVHHFAKNEVTRPAAILVSEGPRRTNLVVVGEDDRSLCVLRLTEGGSEANLGNELVGSAKKRSTFGVAADEDAMLVD